jgi:hypothetical protein
MANPPRKRLEILAFYRLTALDEALVCCDAKI